MRQITHRELIALAAAQSPPCVSLYLPTHRFHPDNQQDRIAYRNLLKEMEASLRLKYSTRDVRALVERFQPLAHDDRFWNHRTDGLAILSSPDTFQVFDLQYTVAELLIVADSFHTKPLRRALQEVDRYQVLGLNRHEAKLYEGNRDALDQLELAEGVPRTIQEALGEELTEAHMTVASYGMAAGGGGGAMHHGHGQKKDEVEIDSERFFRAVDRAILQHHSRPTGLPLILAALPEHHELFREVSHNPFLVAGGITLDPQSISPERLRVEAWRVMEPGYRERLAKLVDEYQSARSKQLGSDDLAQVAQAGTAGRVGTLLVEYERQIPGKIDRGTGQIHIGNLSDPEVDDVLDDLAELVVQMRGDVVVVPTERMPSSSGVAAIYRY